MEKLQDRLGYHFNTARLLEEALYPAQSLYCKAPSVWYYLMVPVQFLDEWYNSEDTIGTSSCNFIDLLTDSNQTQKLE